MIYWVTGTAASSIRNYRMDMAITVVDRKRICTRSHRAGVQ